MRVTNNIYVLSGSYYGAIGDGGMAGEVYGIHTPEGMILIDSGMAKAGLAQIQETMAYYGIKEKISHVIITHSHLDHTGSAKAIQEMGAKIIVGAEDAYMCTNGGYQSHNVNSPFNDTFTFDAFTPDLLIDQDCTLEINGLQLTFIKTPGHTPGSMVIQVKMDGKTALFTGDVLEPEDSSFSDICLGWQGDVGFDRAAVVESMMKLFNNYQADIILPGHGKLCLKNGTKLLRQAAKIAMLTMR